jgi:hypothetical protein
MVKEVQPGQSTPWAVFGWSVLKGAEQTMRYKGDVLHWHDSRKIDWLRDTTSVRANDPVSASTM